MCLAEEKWYELIKPAETSIWNNSEIECKKWLCQFGFLSQRGAKSLTDKANWNHPREKGE